MLDVHPPHGKLHGLGDFLLHLFTITVGLLIALALEGCVERAHKRELRQDAETNLQQEIRDNRKEWESSKAATATEIGNLKAVLDFLEARKAGRTPDIKGLNLSFTFGTLRDASWRTATATGALGLLDYGEVQRYAEAYQVQEELVRVEHLALDDFLGLQSYVIYGFDPAKLTPTDAAAAEPDVRHTLAHLVAMQQIGDGVEQTYDKALGGEKK